MPARSFSPGLKIRQKVAWFSANLSLALSLLIVCLLVLVGSSVSLAQERQSLSTGRDDKAIQCMKREFDWKMEQVPLTDVAETVGKWCGINVWVDVKALEEVGVGTDTPLTFHGKRVPLDVALKRMLEPIELTWTVMDGLIIFTTPEVVETHLSTRIYNVRDLLAKSYSSDGSTNYDFDSLIELISGTISPNTWDAVGGPGSIQEFTNDFDVALVISQTHDVHSEIDELFRMLRMLPNDGRRYREASVDRTSRGRSGSSVNAQRRTVLAPAWPPVADGE
jgi:hypothetical protein